jgi:ABC-type transport system involved in multi-copper enzyme maturation permease subunit
MTAVVPGAGSTVWTLAGLTLQRLVRGKALWIGALIAGLPVMFAVGLTALRGAGSDEPTSADEILYATMPLLVLLPALFVAASISEELESRTSTYLWSRPIARWAVLAGKLCALVPVVIVLVVAGWVAAVALGTHAAPPVMSCVALAAGCVVIALIATGISASAPRHGMALTIGYMLVDAFIGVWPFSLAELSITHQARVLAHLDAGAPALATPVLAMAVVAGIWGTVGFARIRNVES